MGGGTISRTPFASGLLLLATLMVTGSPPFGLFWSELAILRAGFAGPHLAVVAVFLAALVILFCGFFYQMGRLTLGESPASGQRTVLPERLDLAMGTTVLAAIVAVVSAFYLPEPLLAMIRAALRVVEGA
jgi:hydrogenase-4 component F